MMEKTESGEDNVDFVLVFKLSYWERVESKRGKWNSGFTP